VFDAKQFRAGGDARMENFGAGSHPWLEYLFNTVDFGS